MGGALMDAQIKKILEQAIEEEAELLGIDPIALKRSVEESLTIRAASRIVTKVEKSISA
jgi:hypothetical protein